MRIGETVLLAETNGVRLAVFHALAAGGAELAHDLDSSAMNKLPASKIDNSSSSNS